MNYNIEINPKYTQAPWLQNNIIFADDLLTQDLKAWYWTDLATRSWFCIRKLNLYIQW